MIAAIDWGGLVTSALNLGSTILGFFRSAPAAPPPPEPVDPEPAPVVFDADMAAAREEVTRREKAERSGGVTVGGAPLPPAAKPSP